MQKGSVLMNQEALIRLLKLNQLSLTEEETSRVLAFFAKEEESFATLADIDTGNVERMVHVMPIDTVVRDDVEKKLFTRDELQASAPETYEGYWQVPRLVE